MAPARPAGGAPPARAARTGSSRRHRRGTGRARHGDGRGRARRARRARREKRDGRRLPQRRLRAVEGAARDHPERQGRLRRRVRVAAQGSRVDRAARLGRALHGRRRRRVPRLGEISRSGSRSGRLRPARDAPNGHRDRLASGRPGDSGLADSRPLTNETLFDLKRPPKRLAILGAGPIGCEIGQAFACMGVDIVLIERAERVLPAEDPRASDAVAAALRGAGASILDRAEVSTVERRGASVSIDVDAAGERVHVVADELLVAAGRRPTTDELNLAAVGVELDAAGRIVVDRYLRTTNPRIYAAGDVCSSAQLTHNADAHARIVVRNALFVPTATTDRLVIPRCTYTSPEVAQIGRLASELERDGVAFDRYTCRFDELDRGRMQANPGFAEILAAAGSDRILGATIVGRAAGELVAPITIAMSLRLGLGAIGSAPLPYPTLSEFLRRAAEGRRRERLSP